MIFVENKKKTRQLKSMSKETLFLLFVYHVCMYINMYINFSFTRVIYLIIFLTSIHTYKSMHTIMYVHWQYDS